MLFTFNTVFANIILLDIAFLCPRWFEDQEDVQRRRAAAQVCLPALPGPSVNRSANRLSRRHVSQEHCQEHRRHGLTRIAGAGQSQPSQHQLGLQTKTQSMSDASSTSQQQCCFQAHQLPDITRTGDVLVVAVGHPELIHADWVKPGAVVIDVGINVLPADISSNHGQRCCGSSSSSSTSSVYAGDSTGDCGCSDAHHSMKSSAETRGGENRQLLAAANTGCMAETGSSIHGRPSSGELQLSKKPASSSEGSSCCSLPRWPYTSSLPSNFQVVGDVAASEVEQIASVMTPVPGGVGPMTIAAVVHNTLQAARYNAGLLAW